MEKDQILLQKIKSLEKKIKELEDSNFLYQNIIENSPYGIHIFDKEGYSLKLNTAQKNILKIDKSEGELNSFNVFKDPFAVASGMNKRFEKVFKGEVWKGEKEYNMGVKENKWKSRKDCRLFKETIIPVKDNEGNVRYAFSTLEDKTEICKNENNLIKNESFLRSILSSMKDLLFILDHEGNYVDFFTTKHEELFAEPESFIGKNFKDIMPLEIIKKVEKAINCIKQNKGPCSFDYSLEVNKKTLWYNAKMSALRNSITELSGYVILCRNITKRVVSEKKLKKKDKKLKKINKKLLESNSTKDKLFSIIAHDLRGPIGSVVGLISLLNDNFNNIEKERVQKLVSSIDSTLHNIYDLLDNLLFWACSQLNKINPKPTCIHLNKNINKCTSILKEAALKKEISIESNIPKDVTVFADKNIVFTIFRNLISNAIKFSNTGKKITISCTKNNSFCFVSIQDNGIGMEAEKVKNLFNISQMETARGTSGEKGTGLGLIICNDFIKKSKGKLNIESQPGIGTTVKVKLPTTDLSSEEAI